MGRKEIDFEKAGEIQKSEREKRETWGGGGGGLAVVAESGDGGAEEEAEAEVEDGVGNEGEVGESRRAPEADR